MACFLLMAHLLNICFYHDDDLGIGFLFASDFG
jgi:hypothetical protein